MVRLLNLYGNPENQTGGQWYSDTFPFGIPYRNNDWKKHSTLLNDSASDEEKKSCIKVDTWY
jgi:hypothetical protein